MKDLLTNIPSEYLAVIITILSAAFLFITKIILRNFKSSFNKIENKLDLLFVDQEATDFALNKCLPSNGKTYADHKADKKKELIKELDYINK
jgi:hypothetical protein